MLAIINKELRSYFYSATAYIFMGIFLFMFGIFFSFGTVFSQSAKYSDALTSMVFLFLLITPILTMKTIAEETKTRTDQLLLTSPQSITSIVLGKYLAAVALFALTLIVTLLYPLILSLFGKLAIAEIFSTYLGFFLMGCCFIAIGLFISSITDSQVVAGVGTLGLLLLLWLLDSVVGALPTGTLAGIIFAIILVLLLAYIVYSSTKNILVAAGTFLVGGIIVLVLALRNKLLFEGFIAKFFGWFSLLQRNDTFAMGVISVSSLIYFISFAFVFVFLTMRIIEKKRWS